MSSIRKRFLFSVGANVARAVISLAVGLLVARGLGPADYGNLAYLLGSFWAIRALLDLGSSSAFYTFISQRSRDYYYYVIYFTWLAFQFLFSTALVTLFLPTYLVERFWLGLDRDLILLALLATFLQNQVWLTVVQLYESERKTVKVQVASVIIILIHLILVAAMLLSKWLSVQGVLWAIILEYSLVTVWLSITIRRVANEKMLPEAVDELKVNSLRNTLIAYIEYCRPMVVVCVFTFAYEIVDRWLLQRYGGATQQGFYQVGLQLSAVSLLATTAILNIFWKEIAEANECGNDERVASLYQRTAQSLVFMAAVISCFLVPWAETLIDLLLGSSYHEAWPVFMLMLFYPVYQAIGQVNGTLFMATGRNVLHMKITVISMLIGIPVSYLLIVPKTGWAEIGLGLGAMGLALKVVGLNLLFVNIQTWLITRYYSIDFIWRRQMGVILALLLIGYVCKYSVLWLQVLIAPIFDISTLLLTLITIVFAGSLYLTLTIALVIWMPRLAGMRQEEIFAYFAKVGSLLRQGKG